MRTVCALMAAALLLSGCACRGMGNIECATINSAIENSFNSLITFLSGLTIAISVFAMMIQGMRIILMARAGMGQDLSEAIRRIIAISALVIFGLALPAIWNMFISALIGPR